MSRQLKTYFTNRNNTSLLEYILLGILLVSFIAFGLVKNLNMDEREHLQATWLIYAGDVPYRDFFEHHHPGMWYLFSLLLLEQAESNKAVRTMTKNEASKLLL